MNQQEQELMKSLNELPWSETRLSDIFKKSNETRDGFLAVGTPEPLPETVRILRPEQTKLLASVEVELRVEVAQFMLSLEQLLDLVPGQIFEQAISSDARLTIRLGDSKVAEGRFVRKDGALALEILSVSTEEKSEQNDANTRIQEQE